MPAVGPSDVEARSWLRSDFGIRADRIETVVGGFDAHATVWSVDDLDGSRWSVKWTRRDTRFGLALARSLWSAGLPGVPEQRLARGDDASPWSLRAGGRLSVSRWIDGREAAERGLDAAEWARFGELLRAVHDHEPPPEPHDREDLTRRGIKRAGDRIGSRLRLADELAGQTQTLGGDAASRLARSWPGIRDRIRSLRAAARRLKKARVPTRRVCCHGDPHLGNVLVDEGGQPWLIDFDDAVVAPREVDLMLIELGVLFTIPVTDTDLASFHSGYGPVELDQDRLLRFGCIRAIEDLLDTVLAILNPDAPDVAGLGEMLDGILSPHGLAGLVEGRLVRE